MSYHPNQILKNSVEREFEAAVLTFLKIIWPKLEVAPAPRGHWNARGIDLLTSTAKRPIQCCVQCKGFHVSELGNKQFYQIRNSIRKFALAQVPVKDYRLVHNRDSRNRSLVRRVELLLHELVEQGLAETAEMWDRKTVLNQVKECVRSDLFQQIREHSSRTLEQLKQLYGPHWAWQYEVPMTSTRYAFYRGQSPEIMEESRSSRQDLRDVLLSEENSRWTMLVGYHGTGKTTAALLAAHRMDRIVLYAECKQFRYENLGGGSNALTKEIARSMGIASDQEGEERDRVYNYIIGRELYRLLRLKDSPLVLIIDGLDENRYYHRTRGLSNITSQLSEANCQVILTMRKEQFDESLGDIGLSLGDAFHDLSQKNASNRHASVLTLGFWSRELVEEFLKSIMVSLEDEHNTRLRRLYNVVHKGYSEKYYGELIYHPLYLSFVIEDVLNFDIRRTSRVSLIENWIIQKMIRDRQVTRLLPDETFDSTKLVTIMFEILENISHSMTSVINGDINLTESTYEQEVETIAEGYFNRSGELTLAILLNSVLVSSGPRRLNRPFQLAFVHRLFQEYFLALALKRRSIPPNGYPTEVRRLYRELEETEHKLIE